MLKLAGEFEVGREKVESLVYSPGQQNSGDLEAATKTITPTSEASGLVNADYSTSLTLSKPGDSRLVIKRICARLSVNIAGLGTAAHIYCRVYVDAQDNDHLLFDKDWTTAGAKLDAADIHSGNKSAIFNLLKDGSAHTLYFFFWADAADQATVDVVQLWEGVGSSSTSGAAVLSVEHDGFVDLSLSKGKTGSGSSSLYILSPAPNDFYLLGFVAAETPDWVQRHGMVTGTFEVNLKGTVATDLNYLNKIRLVLRSEQ